MIPDNEQHMHCGECRRAIQLFDTLEDGTTVELPIELGTQFMLREVAPRQLEPIQIPVPLCDECAARLKQQQSQNVSKLIIPQPQVPPNLKQ